MGRLSFVATTMDYLTYMSIDATWCNGYNGFIILILIIGTGPLNKRFKDLEGGAKGGRLTL